MFKRNPVVLMSTLIAFSIATLSAATAQNYPSDTSGNGAAGSNAPGGMTGNQNGLGSTQSGNGSPSDEGDNGTLRGGQQQSKNPRPAFSSGGGTYNDNGERLPNGERSANPIRQSTPVVPPAPPTEFQRLIAASLGQTLPIFGAALFSGVPSTFAPLDQVPVTADYVIGPGDELRVHIWGQVNFNANVDVDSSGAIYLPQVGAVHVSGLHSTDLDSHLRSAVGRIYRNFDLSVELGQLRSIQVLVVGQARRPGTYTVSSLSTLVNALFFCGGPSPEGSMRQIQLKRADKLITTFDVYDLLVRGDKSKDVALLPGDIIFIPPVGPQVALAGSVRTAAIYELKGDTSIGALLTLAGGRSSVAADSRISIESISSRHSREAMEVASDEAGMATLVHDGDLVRLLSLVPRFEKTVTLRGNLANPGHFAWHPGMRLSELIPDRASLITRNYWLRRGALGLPVPEFEADTHVDAGSATDRRIPGQIEAGRSTLAAAQQQVATENTITPSSLNDVALFAPEIDWKYAVIERLDAINLSTSLLPFDLGKLVLEHDASQDLELLPGDTVTIFSQADIRVPLNQQTKFVRLDGEFVRSGVYSVMPGETLRSLVTQAGGMAPNAYLYGSEFTRASTRAIQQQRLDEYVRSLEVQIQRSQLNLAASAISALDSQAAGAAATPQENLLNRLRQLRASGRIVLELKPDSVDVSSLPDLPLEDGDHFTVPPKPANVNVVGAVYDQNSFLYSSTRRVGDYLRLAGGPTRDADAHRAFIIRADGSVLSRAATSSLWGNGFDGVRLYPGDTAVMPEKVFKASALRGFLDWSQLVSQFALGAAAVNVVK